MSSTIIAKFGDGRLLVREVGLVEYRYCGSGVPFKIHGLQGVEKVLSVTNNYEGYGLLTPLEDVKIGQMISGKGVTTGLVVEKPDTIVVVMKKGDMVSFSDQQTSGVSSGATAKGFLSGITTEAAYMGEIISGKLAISGVVQITAWCIGY